MGRRKKRSRRSPDRQGNSKERLSVTATASQTPWWKRFSAGLVTLVCAPIIAGVAIAIITQEFPPMRGTMLRLTRHALALIWELICALNCT
jgi:hypothetical protein